MDRVEGLARALIEARVKTGRRVDNFHSCRLTPPNYDSYAYAKDAQKHDGKGIDVVYGISGKGANRKSRIQALRYDRRVWTEASARAHCKGRGGKFDPAKGEMTRKERR